ncbi:VWA domain-containing protein [Brevibacillus migulae]|uniref:VWA domain-containing protein n=1 Tax=Brevibacillus migulae TaxID=1644114 RepID=UPI0014320180|nr:VWA domain-containing protein [Brevibacillus migulae]
MTKTRMKTLSHIILYVLLATSLIGCTTSEPTSTPQPQPTTTQTSTTEEAPEKQSNAGDTTKQTGFKKEVPKPPSTGEELFAYPKGIFAGKRYEENQREIEETLDQFPLLSESNEEEYWNQLVFLFAEKYSHPSSVLDTWINSDLEGPQIDSKITLKEHLNVEIVLDASGSMAKKIGGATMMEQAKKAIREFAAALPQNANIALRVYGHKGSGSDEDKAISCGSSELIYSLRPYNAQELNQGLNKFKPTGWTPIALSLEGVKEDLAPFTKEDNTNIVYLVSDGVETCGGDPVKVAKELADSNISPIINIIGFDVDSQGENQLKKIAESAGGTYVTVKNQEQLMKEFDRSKDLAQKWSAWYTKAIQKKMELSKNITQAGMDFNREMTNSKFTEYQNLNSAINYLSKISKISHDDTFTFRKRLDEREELIESVQDELDRLFSESGEKRIEELEKIIEEKYKTNTNSN